jgi:hypothetical protein
MPFKKGQSGNPRGRVPKERALTAILEAELNKPVDTIDGRRIAAKRQISAMITEFAATGRVTFPDGRMMEPKSVDEYFNVIRWLYKHIDGDKTHIDVTSMGESVAQRIEIIPADDASVE